MLYYIYFLRTKILNSLIFNPLHFRVLVFLIYAVSLGCKLVSVSDFSIIYLGLWQSLTGKVVLFS